MGAPKGSGSKYKKDYDRQAAFLAARGVIDKELAVFFGVNEVTIHNWKRNHPSFAQALKKAKEEPDERVVNSLYNRALGMTLTERSSGPKGEIVTRKEIAPDTVAMIYWLKNRRPHEWRDKHEIEHSGEIHAHFDPAEKDI